MCHLVYLYIYSLVYISVAETPRWNIWHESQESEYIRLLICIKFFLFSAFCISYFPSILCSLSYFFYFIIFMSHSFLLFLIFFCAKRLSTDEWQDKYRSIIFWYFEVFNLIMESYMYIIYKYIFPFIYQTINSLLVNWVERYLVDIIVFNCKSTDDYAWKKNWSCEILLFYFIFLLSIIYFFFFYYTVFSSCRLSKPSFSIIYSLQC